MVQSLPHPPAGPRHGHLQRPRGVPCSPPRDCGPPPRSPGGTGKPGSPTWAEGGPAADVREHQQGKNGRRGRRGLTRQLGALAEGSKRGSGLPGAAPLLHAPLTARGAAHTGGAGGLAQRQTGSQALGQAQHGQGGPGQGRRFRVRQGPRTRTRTRTHTHTHSYPSGTPGTSKGSAEPPGPRPHGLQLLAGLSQWEPGAVAGRSGGQRRNAGRPSRGFHRHPRTHPKPLQSPDRTGLGGHGRE